MFFLPWRQDLWRQAPSLGANEVGAKHPATSAPRRSGLGANDPGVMPLYLGTDDYGAKNMVHFLKIFPPGVYLRDSFEKGPKNKKRRA
jgi:hypothetical protein